MTTTSTKPDFAAIHTARGNFFREEKEARVFNSKAMETRYLFRAEKCCATVKAPDSYSASWRAVTAEHVRYAKDAVEAAARAWKLHDHVMGEARALVAKYGMEG